MISLIKSFFRDTLSLPPILVIVVTGLAGHLLMCLILQKPVYSAWGLLGPLLLGITLEGYEIWDYYRDVGLFAPENDSLAAILLRHGRDVLKMLALPLLLVTVGKWL